MKTMMRAMVVVGGVALAGGLWAQTPAPAGGNATGGGTATQPAGQAAGQPTGQPATQPAAPPKAEDLLKQLLKPTTRQTSPALEPGGLPGVDESTKATVAPKGQPLNVMREGSYVFNRLGRLSHTNDGQAEFVFESDGQAMQDPPLLIHPNLKLWMMESAVKANTGRQPRFRVTGMVTEYGNRNYILIEKMAVMQELPERPQTR